MKFVILFVGRGATPDAEDEVTKAYNQKWGEWMGDLAASGKLESGGPFQTDGTEVEKSGPKPLELKELDVGGYVVLEAASLEEASKIAGTAPNIELGGSAIVREIAPVGPGPDPG